MASCSEVATGIPVNMDPAVAIPVRKSNQVPHGLFDRMGVPPGIAEAFQGTVRNIPLRIWIIDNSGSMATTDGTRLLTGTDGQMGMVKSTRWQELCDSLKWHAQMASSLCAPTEFRMLNPPDGGVPQIVHCGYGNPEAENRAADAMLSSQPTGRTPLCEQIYQVVQAVTPQAANLRAAGHRVTVVIASDGAATDGDVASAMRPLENLPVWLVVRLCTDDDAVLRYWNSIDEDLELDIDVLDDWKSEATEVCTLNPWLCYGISLHRLREWGTTVKVFDVIDEKKLGPGEVQQLVQLIIGSQAADLPNPQLDWSNFEASVKMLQQNLPLIWDPIRNRKQPWFDTSRMKKALVGGGCSIQ